MSTRRPLQPVSPLSANIAGSYGYHSTQAIHGTHAMDKRAQEDTHESGSDVSGLTSLENDADDFERLMIQNARDERRLNDALHGKVQPFRKARVHSRVGVTLENLERHNERNEGALGANARVKFDSPPGSSEGSARSDPAIHAPISWGRKARTNRNWLRTITAEVDQTAGAQEDTMNRRNRDEDETVPRRTEEVEADRPRPSVEDSPLSRKSSIQGTPASMRHRDFQPLHDWDISMDLNEASLIASTPYIPRNTALDDIRQREIESIREQGVTRNRLEEMREGSPEQRRPRSSSARSADRQSDIIPTSDQAAEGSSSSIKSRNRGVSWQSIGKSQAVTNDDAGKSPILVSKKSTETVGVVKPDVQANAQAGPQRPPPRRDNSRDLLRSIARISSTPSPARIASTRPQTAPARQLESSSQPRISEISPDQGEPSVAKEQTKRPTTTASESSNREDMPMEAQQTSKNPPEPTQEAQPTDMDATPLPTEQPVKNLKTPVVTGAWVDTPGPRTATKSDEIPRVRSRSPKKESSPTKPPQEVPTEGAAEAIVSDSTRATRPRSALQAIVEEARAARAQRPDDFGDSTINSLEELITPLVEASEAGEIDEDTLQGLQLPTGTPRNEAERQRHQELLQLYRMNERLRAARTSIRDANRGMRAVEHRVEHVEDLGRFEIINGEKVKIVYRDCPCAQGAEHQYLEFSLWRWFSSFFYDARLKQKKKRRLGLTGWGITGFSIFLVCFLIWFTAENIACDYHCQEVFTSFRPARFPFGVNPNPAIFPFVLPTLFYRYCMKFWCDPLMKVFTWICGSAYTAMFGGDAPAATKTATSTYAVKSQNRGFKNGLEQDWGIDGSMLDDEIAHMGARW